jgi:hypothetical protein
MFCNVKEKSITRQERSRNSSYQPAVLHFGFETALVNRRAAECRIYDGATYQL